MVKEFLFAVGTVTLVYSLMFNVMFYIREQNKINDIKGYIEVCVKNQRQNCIGMKKDNNVYATVDNQEIELKDNEKLEIKSVLDTVVDTMRNEWGK